MSRTRLVRGMLLPAKKEIRSHAQPNFPSLTTAARPSSQPSACVPLSLLLNMASCTQILLLSWVVDGDCLTEESTRTGLLGLLPWTNTTPAQPDNHVHDSHAQPVDRNATDAALWHNKRSRPACLHQRGGHELSKTVFGGHSWQPNSCAGSMDFTLFAAAHPVTPCLLHPRRSHSAARAKLRHHSSSFREPLRRRAAVVESQCQDGWP